VDFPSESKAAVFCTFLPLCTPGRTQTWLPWSTAGGQAVRLIDLIFDPSASLNGLAADKRP